MNDGEYLKKSHALTSRFAWAIIAAAIIYWAILVMVIKYDLWGSDFLNHHLQWFIPAGWALVGAAIVFTYVMMHARLDRVSAKGYLSGS
ncbi:MAG: hypothetical protein KBC81_00755 [Candidatus Pacebacteria bacterium]|nr:hypothetical protein [Candidatus Paceibacterota bacterium]